MYCLFKATIAAGIMSVMTAAKRRTNADVKVHKTRFA